MKTCYLCNKPVKRLDIVVPIAIVMDEGAVNNDEYIINRKHIAHLDCVMKINKNDSKKPKKNDIKR